MSSFLKYRVHEVAKDFGLSSKDVSKILTDYIAAPKNHMQVLTDEELNVVFDYLTQHNEIEDLEAYFDEARLKKEAASASPASDEPPKAAEAPASAGVQAEIPSAAPPAEKAEEPARANAQRPAAAQAPQKPQQARPEPPRPQMVAKQTRVIDTKAAEINLSKYDDRVDKLVPDSAHKIQYGKQKIKKSGDKKPGGQAGFNKRRQEELEKMRRLHREVLKKQPVKVMIPDEISVGELASRMKKTGSDVVRQLVKNGIMASLSQIIDYDTAALIALDMGCKVEREVTVTIEDRLIDDSADKEEDLIPRSPVVVVMGHVDHGKTSLLDAIRGANVVSGEAGGITQHIGAYTVDVGGQRITFLDTPGHEAFTSMRLRGATVTDIAILVVAADDGIMPQTVEAINHAKAADIPIIVAVNKMDKPDANPDRVMQQLTEHSLIPEEWGGETIICKVSASTRDGLENLLEMVLLTAEMKELRANPKRLAKGTVIEARLDKGRGPISTVLVQNGTLRSGDVLIAGQTVGRVRAMTDFRGRKITEAGPSTPVEIIGLSEVPMGGDIFNVVENERMARELVDQRKFEQKESRSTAIGKVSLEDLFAQIQQGNIKDLNIIVKADVQGSAEAVKASLEKLTNEEVRVRVIHSAVGAVSESDILLASTSSAIVVGFNVRPEPSAAENAKRMNVDIRLYRIIYECIEEIESAMKGLLAPKHREEVLGHAQVRQTFKVSSIGTIAGCYMLDGKIARPNKIRVVRDGIVVHEGLLASLKRFKDDVREVSSGYECGISVERFNDIKEGDIIEAFEMVEIKR